MTTDSEIDWPGIQQMFTLGQVFYQHLTRSFWICKMVLRGVNGMMSKFLLVT